MNVECFVEETEIEDEDGAEHEGVRVTCKRCGHITESFGVGGSSHRRCAALLREECPRNEINFYVLK